MFVNNIVSHKSGFYKYEYHESLVKNIYTYNTYRLLSKVIVKYKW